MSREKSDPLAVKAPKKKGRKKVILALGIIVLLIGGYFTYQKLNTKDATYLTMPVQTGKITDSVQATGTVEPMQEADLKYKQDGNLKTLNAKVGLKVTQGQVLAVQDDADLRTSVDQAANSVTQAKLKLSQAQMDLNKARTTAERQEALYKEGGISKSDVESARLDLSNAVLSVEMARASISSAQVQQQIAQNTLEDAILSAPFSGIISSVEGEVGQDSSIVAIHMISPELQVVAQVNEADISRVKVNQTANLTLASQSSNQVRGTVKQISPQAVSVNNVQQYEVTIAVDNTNNILKPGMSVTANIIVSESTQETALVPNLAFTYAQTFKGTSSGAVDGSQRPSGTRPNRATGNKAASQSSGSQASMNGNSGAATGNQSTAKRVVVLENGQPVVKMVQTGLSDGTNTEVVSGLQAGEKVIIGTSDGSTRSGTGNSNSNSNSGSSKSNSNGNRGPGGPPMF